MTIKYITLDLDDTLWPCAPLIKQAEERFYHWLVINKPKISDRYTCDEIITHRMHFIQRYPELIHNLTLLRKKWLAALSAEVGYNNDWIEDGFNVFWIARNEVNLFDGVESILTTLSAQYKLAAITNGNTDLALCGLRRFFEFSVHSEEVGACKPDARVFEYALRLADVDVHEVIHVGDDPVRDIVGAKRLNMHAIWVNLDKNNWPDSAEYAPYKADIEIQTLNDFEAAVEEIARGAS